MWRIKNFFQLPIRYQRVAIKRRHKKLRVFSSLLSRLFLSTHFASRRLTMIHNKHEWRICRMTCRSSVPHTHTHSIINNRTAEEKITRRTYQMKETRREFIMSVYILFSPYCDWSWRWFVSSRLAISGSCFFSNATLSYVLHLLLSKWQQKRKKLFDRTFIKLLLVINKRRMTINGYLIESN
jgi:hypothetical protein